FSDGGRFSGIGSAVAHGCRMAEEGADIIDVGGESTRPGAQPVEAAEQCRRVLPVIRALRAELPASVQVSVDTTLSAVAAPALDAGVEMINDISAGRDDAGILELAARSSVQLVLMHMQGTPATMQQAPAYQDVVAQVSAFLAERAAMVMALGMAADRILLDPGIGFGKRKHHNLALLANLDRIVELGHPVLLGASRKRFMGSICARGEPEDLMPATCATTAMGVMAGVGLFRVHDVAANRQAADVAWAVRQASSAGGVTR
ncbi:MAG TPA: dihydropteroate synthase, partial [Gammaproteobacteria bacterium]|nr:dihydropteroate synthase [Gammaproteobacteria bacterium]